MSVQISSGVTSKQRLHTTRTMTRDIPSGHLLEHVTVSPDAQSSTDYVTYIKYWRYTSMKRQINMYIQICGPVFK